MTFDNLNLLPALLKALSDMEFVAPSAIQEKTIPVLLEGRDVIALAQTGTGKTAAFALPILQLLQTDSPKTQALIVAPTRELAIQVADQFMLLSKYQKNITVATLCGGQDYTKQLKQLRTGAQVVVGTPGRILDHMERGTLQLNQLKTIVLDEADEMLHMGFIDDIEAIIAKAPAEKQVALFSATMPGRIRTIATKYMHDAVSVEIKMETATVKTIEQRFLFASLPQKNDALLRLLAVEPHQGVIVFVRTKSATEEVAEVLQRQGLRAMAIHGDISQNLRERIITQFRAGTIDILVATDVAARGLDVTRVSHVINYDMPHDCETYVHRIGRTGRAGRTGVTILFVTPRESRMITTIERHTRQSIIKIQIPDDRQITEARAKTFMANISTRLEHENLPAYIGIIEDYLKAEPSASAVHTAAALALLLNQDKPWQRQFDLPKSIRLAKEERSSQGRGPSFNKHSERNFDNKRPSQSRMDDNGSSVTFRLDVGRVHGVKPGNIVGAIANEAGIQSRFITGLKINDDHSTVRLPKSMPKEVINDLMKAWVCGRQLKLTVISA